ncbi:PREDICTED: probable pectinesterase/pectinesterase inhibitor 51 [Tarenaya hassleriana]|uniref:probable pectinesterase/pectinesterase inhibitor 51 n=1 Tax=Tarenaya hassleriana TaxID=28532 RepID=UPI00053C537F|nr:PREDICTED: probable pectinesterase/pectinesterase inhibitor 51 [Tarenaya hassleriana]
MASPKLPHSLSSSSASPFAPSAVKSHRKKSPSRCCCFIILAMSTVLLLFSVFFFFSMSHSYRHSRHHPPAFRENSPPSAPPVAQIRLACKATRFPDPCVASLSEPGRVPPDPNPSKIIHSAIAVSFDNLKIAQSKVKSVLDSSAANPNRTKVANTCLEILSYSEHRTVSTDEALARGKIKDARAWMSAAVAYQYDCWSGLKYVNDTEQVGETMSFLDGLVKLSSNALSMMVSYDNFGDDVASWVPPATERDGFWQKAGPSVDPGTGPRLGFPSGLTEDVTVCKVGGNDCYKTVQEAVDAAPENNGGRKFVIRIKEGVYEETVRVPFEKKNVVFIGDGMGKTVITGSLNVGQPGMTTYNSATVGVLGDGFLARDLTIQNTAGPDAHQAVAFRSDSDFSILENCEFLGNQDTVYAHSLRQFYRNCRIQGNVDFIFGNSASVFQDCQILVAPRQSQPEHGENNAVTAHGRIDPSQSTGFVFLNCSINGTNEYMTLFKANPKVHKNYLGRPWKEFSRTVFIGCNLEALITPDGWMPWSGDFALKTLFYGEYKNTGPGSDTKHRVAWSSQIPDEHVHVYSVANFIQADEWASTTA